MIELKKVSKKFTVQNDTVRAIDQVDLKINNNEIFGLIGQSGAGKSTLLRFINGLLMPDEGSVSVDGVIINQLTDKALRHFRRDVSMVFQQFNLLNNLTVAQNVQLPLKLHHYDTVLSVEEVLERVGLLDKQNHYPSQLSGGQKQRVGIARSLITQPKIMLLDEPTSALDEQITQEIVQVLQTIHHYYPMTMVVVTHQLSLIQSLCDRAGIMQAGRLLQVLSITKQRQSLNDRSYEQYVQEVLKDD